jgi:hypothetical protein
MNREQIIEKIKKVFALSNNNSSVEEATAAAQLAQQLMHKYHIEEIDLAETVEKLIEEEYTTGTGNKWKYILSSTIAKNFCVKAYWFGKATVRFYGRSTDVEIAKETYKFLFNLCVSLARKADYQERKKTGSTNGAGRSFALGFVEGVSQELGKQYTALMIITPKEVEDGYKELMKTKNFRPIRNTYKYSQTKYYNDGEVAGKAAIGKRSIAAN